MPMPEDETTWATLQIMFATSSGDVRRNELSDFDNINRDGKIAMELERATRSPASKSAPRRTTCC